MNAAPSKVNQNEHFVSQLLLRRFTDSKHKLKRYSLEFKKWEDTVPSRTFSSKGYTQLLVDGKINNTLEQEFSKVESRLPITLAELDTAVANQVTVLSSESMDNLCLYLAFLFTLSPFFKSTAPAQFVLELNKQILSGEGDLLDILFQKSKEKRDFWKSEIQSGKGIIFQGTSYLQLIHRVQLERECNKHAENFRQCVQWRILKSPIVVPIADSALMGMRFKSFNQYTLPISPNLLLTGLNGNGYPPNVRNRIECEELSIEKADAIIDAICLSAQLHLVSSVEIDDVPKRRNRAKGRGHFFHNIKDPEDVIAAGTLDFKGDLRLVAVTLEEFESFLKNHVGND